MKKFYIMVLVLLASLNAAAKPPTIDLDKEWKGGVSKPADINKLGDDYVKNHFAADIRGRNKNIVEARQAKIVQHGDSLSKTVVSQRNTSLSAQVEGLESTMGEIVQKFEDDRLKISEEHRDIFDKNVKKLTKVYDTVNEVIVEWLGQEQDPKVKNAFKCAKYAEDSKKGNCIKGVTGNDKHKIQPCSDGKRLHWTGSEWTCIGVFSKPKGNNCKIGENKLYGQWKKESNGGTVCVDYVYTWSTTKWSGCRDGHKTRSVECHRRKNATDTSFSKVDNSEDGPCPGPKPDTKEEC